MTASFTWPAHLVHSSAAALMLAVATLTHAANLASADPPRVFELDNGAEVHLLPYPDIGWVGIIAAYDVGFLHEPEGRSQLSHLVEHLRITAAVGDAGPNEVWTDLSVIGSANGETQTGFTYYDMLVPTDRLELALQTEADRLTDLAPTQDDLAREGPRAASEATNMLAAPDPFLHKFALMAAMQGWVHDADHAAIVEGLDAIPIAEAEAFRTDWYTPANLTLLIAGDFDPTTVRAAVDRTIGAVQPAPAPPAPAIDWSNQPDERRITWDVPRSVVIVGYEPPADAFERFAVTAAMALLPALFQTDETGPIGPILGSGLQWPVGEMPTMALAVVREGSTADEAVAELTKRLDDLADQGLPPPFIVALRAGQTLPTLPTRETLTMQARQLAAMRGMDESQAAGMAAAQTALNMLVLNRAASGEPDAMRDQLRQRPVAAWRDLLSGALAPHRRFITIIEPANPQPR